MDASGQRLTGGDGPGPEIASDGVSELDQEPRSPGAAVRVALAGPVASLGISALFLALAATVHLLDAALVAAGFAWLAVVKRGAGRNAQVTSTDDSRTAVLMVPTDEEQEIAHQTRTVLGLSDPAPAGR